MAYDIEVIARECAGESDRPPLLFVHGAGHGAWCWAEHFLDFFAGHGFNSYALSLRGHGFRALLELVYLRPDRARIAGVPMLVLGGGRDYFIRPPAIRRTADAYGADAMVLPGLAHNMMLDAGWRQAAEAMLAWLQRTLGAGGA